MASGQGDGSTFDQRGGVRILVLGAPVTLALQASGRHTQTTILRVLHHPIVEIITNPLVVLFFFSVTMIGYFLTPFYPFSLEHPLLRIDSSETSA
jgi:cytochrome c oxidase assembly factor CtaG